MMFMIDDRWWWMKLTDERWRWISRHVSCMMNLHADLHVGAFRDVSALLGFSLKQRGGTTADAADRWVQTNKWRWQQQRGRKPWHREKPLQANVFAHRSFRHIEYVHCRARTHIKYCLDHGDHGYCIGHICCSIHSEDRGTMKYKLERSGCRRRSRILLTSQFASQSLQSGFGP